MKQETSTWSGVCPICGRSYTGRPALDRNDGSTFICPDCGVRQALESIGVPPEDRERILQMAHEHT